jgi:glycosyltransferase involved in cell wall biosynthesis
MPNPRVAICQPYFILGGRLSLVLEIVKSLNSIGIEPDIVSLGYSFTPDQIRQKYGHDLRMNFRTVARWSPWRWLPQDYQILVFNKMLGKIGESYDLLINSSNSQIHLPAKPQILSYIHFPREYRIKHGVTESYFTHSGKMLRAFARLSDGYLQSVYAHPHANPQHHIVCNSEYSRDCFRQIFPDYNREIPVIYPPVQMDKYEHPAVKARSGIISLGRFTRLKMQLEQIKLAEQLPGVDFHLIGFVTDQAYFERCRDYVRDRRLTNVHLHPNLDQEQMIGLLNSTKYFLHTLVDEPFGITAVEAITAGCIPIVHNSGGQKETVPIAALRYASLDEVPGIINNLELKDAQEVNDLISFLQSHARENFNEHKFLDKMSLLLKQILSF